MPRGVIGLACLGAHDAPPREPPSVGEGARKAVRAGRVPQASVECPPKGAPTVVRRAAMCAPSVFLPTATAAQISDRLESEMGDRLAPDSVIDSVRNPHSRPGSLTNRSAASHGPRTHGLSPCVRPHLQSSWSGRASACEDVPHPVPHASSDTVTVTPAAGASRLPLSSTTRHRIVRVPDPSGFHS